MSRHVLAAIVAGAILVGAAALGRWMARREQHITNLAAAPGDHELAWIRSKAQEWASYLDIATPGWWREDHRWPVDLLALDLGSEEWTRVWFELVWQRRQDARKAQPAAAAPGGGRR